MLWISLIYKYPGAYYLYVVTPMPNPRTTIRDVLLADCSTNIDDDPTVEALIDDAEGSIVNALLFDLHDDRTGATPWSDVKEVAL